jgi:CRP-like cAMP-binding protein
VYQVVSGAVRLEAPLESDAWSTNKIVRAGEVFGLAAVLQNDSVNMLRATADEHTTLREFKGAPIQLLHARFGGAVAARFLLNFLETLAAQSMEVLRAQGAAFKTMVKVHPDYPIDPQRWMELVERALPSGIMAKLFTKMQYKAGEVIVPAGEIPRACYILRSGEVGSSGPGNESPEILAAPQLLGGLAFFGGVPSLVTLSAASTVEAVPLTHKEIELFIDKNADEAVALIDAIARLMIFQYMTIVYRR